MAVRSLRMIAMVLAFTLAADSVRAQPVSRRARVLAEQQRGEAAPSPGPFIPGPLPDAGRFDDARQTRNQLRSILRQYPPSLTQILSLDPSLLSDPAYLAPYPALVAFLKEHPDVARNSVFFFGQPEIEWSENTQASVRIRAIRDALGGIAVLIGFVTFVSMVGWVAKMLIDHRRWLRVARTQTEVHTKLLDRMTSNEELLAYIQTPAGRRFLEAAPSLDQAPRVIGAPVGRILWSIQVGTVLALVGLGVLYLSARTAADPNLAEAAPFLFMIGTVATATGAGFLVSAGLAYLVSRHLGLLERPTSTTSTHA